MILNLQHRVHRDHTKRTKQHLCVLCAVLVCFMLKSSLVLPADNPYAGKKLIEYGWDVPSTRTVRQDVRKMETVAFDGVVIKVLAGPDQRESSESLGWRMFSKVAFKPEEYQHAIADLKATRFERFSDNFIQSLAMPGLDWFDPDWSAPLHNAAIMARIARAGGMKGLMFDPEDYGSGMWNYVELAKKDPAHHSWDEYVKQVRTRGAEFMRAVNGEYPDITLLCLVGPALSWGHVDIKTDRYGLLYAFFEGMCQAATPGTTIVDGFEQAYPFKERKQFQDGRKHVLEWSKTLFADPVPFERHMRAGFGLWMDFDSGKKGWHPDDIQQNYFTPAAWRASLAYALEASDRYVWVYTERARWWDFNVPLPYIDALALAKQGPGP